MNNKIVLLAMISVFTAVSCFKPFALIAVALAVITFAMVILLDFMREKKLDNDALAKLDKRIAELDDKYKKLSQNLLRNM